mmetsp:Transcript_26150/g.54571  ORF Transcript_26150/g.54571 Transcript_26150/m.54571 type:complete len:161 (-) Transcript_26150:2568-3050(-)
MDACESGVCNPVENEIALPQESAPNDQENRSENEDPSYSRWLRFAIRRDVWVKILGKVIENPVLWGIAIGFFLTLSKIGPKYLKASSPDYVSFHTNILSTFVTMTSPSFGRSLGLAGSPKHFAGLVTASLLSHCCRWESGCNSKENNCSKYRRRQLWASC